MKFLPGWTDTTKWITSKAIARAHTRKRERVKHRGIAVTLKVDRRILQPSQGPVAEVQPAATPPTLRWMRKPQPYSTVKAEF